MERLFENRIVVLRATWLVTRFARRPPRLLLPAQFRDGTWTVDLPTLQLVISGSRGAIRSSRGPRGHAVPARLDLT